MKESRRLRWTIAGIVLTLTAVLAGVLIWVKGQWPTWIRGNWDPPAPALVFPAAAAPVPGWRVRLSGLGLPEDTAVKSVIGKRGDTLVLEVERVGSAERWVVALNVRTAKVAFPSAALTPTQEYPPHCYLNGPTVLCVGRTGGTLVAWVIDADVGTLAFYGPTTLLKTRNVEPAGGYLVSTASNGISGIGSDTESTWFVPGEGVLYPIYRAESGSADRSLAVQNIDRVGSGRSVVFALSDGAIVTPTLPEGRVAIRSTVYPGGFAVEVGAENGNRLKPDEVLFFDNGGNRLGRIPVSRTATLSANSPDLPVLDSHDGAMVFAPDGDELLFLRKQHINDTARRIGARFFVRVSNSGNPKWTQYDLRTGAEGSTCELPMDRYIAGDEKTAILGRASPGAEFVARGVDLDSCETLWRIPSQPNSHSLITRVNTTLIQVSDDGKELMSLLPGGTG